MTIPVRPKRRRFLAPEVIQSSEMDCGPASLKCLLEGFGISVSYGRLREACQTDVDGTSIDTIEEIACQLGLDAEQIMVPADHVLLNATSALPAIAVVLLPNGFTHFVVAWRKLGGFVQVMDPATRRHFIGSRRFVKGLFIHTMPVEATAWREYAGTEDFLAPLRCRLRELGIEPEPRLARASADVSWRGLGTLDAATRMTHVLKETSAVSGSDDVARLLDTLWAEADEDQARSEEVIPSQYWHVRLDHTDEGGEQLIMRGAVLVRMRRPRPVTDDKGESEIDGIPDAAPPPLSPELQAALAEPSYRPLRTLFGLMRADGLFSPFLIGLALVAAAGLTLVEALLLRAFVDLAFYLPLPLQRLGAVGTLATFTALLLVVDYATGSGLRRAGRNLEGRLRIAFLEKLPRLGDQYFRSRPVSDMATRSHSIHAIRTWPTLGGQTVRTAMELLAVSAGLVWLAPSGAWLVVGAVLASLVLPWLAQKPLSEQEMRFRVHASALSQFYLDALLGLVAIRSHGAERSLRRNHESTLVEWARSGYTLASTSVTVQGLEALLGACVAILLVTSYLRGVNDAGAALLLVYWALTLPILGIQLAMLLQSYPTHRNVTLRVLEPLGAPEAEDSTSEVGQHDCSQACGSLRTGRSTGMAIELSGVSILAAGRTILRDVELKIEPGEHVAIVGSSGAGKSSLLGLFLGWHRAASGSFFIDGRPMTSARLPSLRSETAWVDPAVQIWNRSLLENLRYGSPSHGAASLETVVDTALLRVVLEQLPEGHQSALGEGGGLVSGGEGQRVRLGRALARSSARLVLLDEPFRGLDRLTRSRLLDRARDYWRRSTLICVTHDIDHAKSFSRVVVVEDGLLCEDGRPEELLEEPNSRFSAILAAQQAVHELYWSSDIWQRLYLDGGRIRDDSCAARVGLRESSSLEGDGSSQGRGAAS